MAYQGLFVDVDYCTGCETCVVACQQEHKYSEKEFGVTVSKLGPLKFGEKKWQYDFIPQFTNWCDLCEDRVAKGKVPTCVQHCQAQVIEYGDVAELAKRIDSPKQFVVAIKES